MSVSPNRQKIITSNDAVSAGGSVFWLESAVVAVIAAGGGLNSSRSRSWWAARQVLLGAWLVNKL